ncbi:LOW QUALITY PROTEIN: hypothetical protein RJ641_014701 [Dillenia turbinata]|uniref:COBRA C-terminal domain-containing protein n=1 Tax=Dillenia turbinata TaxID=194707 RepID=A0AAN8UPY3_9MAGN
MEYAKRGCKIFLSGQLNLVISAVLYFVIFSRTGAYDPLDPNGNITIKWDVISWTPDGCSDDEQLPNVSAHNDTQLDLVVDMGKERSDFVFVIWNVTCTYSQFLVSKNPSYCVSFSSFYNDSLTPCPSCACGCQNKAICVMANSKLLDKVGVNTPRKDGAPILQCTHHMCPIHVHWHVKQNYKDYWRVKITITNFNFRLNYTQWTLMVQHLISTMLPNLDYKPLVPYESINDTGMFYGMKIFNDQLMEAGPKEMCSLRNTFTLKQGLAFPGKIYFNGEECRMPSLCIPASSKHRL